LSKFSGLRQCALPGAALGVSGGHQGLRNGVREGVPEAARQRCDVHFRRNIGEPRKDLAAWLERWQGKYRRLTD
jgi:putative transposase